MNNKYQKKKNKSWTDWPLMDHQKSTLTEDSEQNLMANNKRKNLQRPLMENLYIDNLTNDITEEEILAILGLGGTTNIRENSLAKKQYREQ